MTTVISGSSPSITFSDSTTQTTAFTSTPSVTSITTSADASISGLTVGKGGGAVSTNTAVGASAIAATATATRSTAVGFEALKVLTSGDPNTALGAYSLKANTTGAANVGVGAYALQSNTNGGSNAAFGNEAMSANTTGTSCVAVGALALASNTTGSNNTAVGYNAGTAATGGSNVFIGVNAGVSGTPTTTGTNNTYIGTGAYGANAGSTKEIVIGFNFQGNGSNTCAIGSDNGKIYSNFTINATWTQTSDGRMKTNIQDDSLGLSFINRLRPIKFTWKPSNELEQDNPYYAEENTRDTTTVIHGLIAQEVKAALDAEGVDTFAGWDMGADGIQAVSREMFVTPLIKAIQELKTIVDAQAAEIAELKAKVGI